MRFASEPGRVRRWLRTLLSISLLAVPPVMAGVALAGWLVYQSIESTLVEKFGGQRWDFPSKLYADAYPLFPGLDTDEDGFTRRLERRGYRPVRDRPTAHGEYRVVADPPAVDLYLKPFQYPTHRERGRPLRLELDAARRIRAIRSLDDGRELYDVFLEPALVTGLHGRVREDRREMQLDEVPVPLVRSVIAVEDRRFFEHRGVDVRGLARAMIVNLKAMGVRQGGSTLTQQLMKNFFLTDDRTVGRKLREAAMALVAERRFDKREILENYMNEIYLGQRRGVGVHGMWEAAEFYFGREPRELTLGQIATLAGMIRAPNYYSPHGHPERAVTRRNTVLRVLLDTGEIDERTYRAALAEPLAAVAPPPGAVRAPYFVDFVREELADRYSARVLTSQGYHIFTTLDLELQTAAEGAVARGLERLERDYPHLTEEPDARLEIALLATNPRTGAILAMVGGRDYAGSQYNHVTDARRQPGSVFKPIVFLAAVGSERVGEKHLLPSSIVEDEPFVWSYEGRTWSPENYEEEFHGPVTVRHALVHSLNAATARLARDVGIEPIRDLAVRLGVDDAIPPYPAIALGGWEVTPLEVARVYGVLANAGLAAEPNAVAKVVGRGGAIVEGHRMEIRRVIPARDAFLITHLLSGVLSDGTGRRARRLGFTRPAAGKTGTTNEYNDAWFAGYTPDLLTIVWVGFDRGAQLGLTGSAAALPIWTEFMKEALGDKPPTPFDIPAGISFVEVDADSGGRAGSTCRHVVREAFLEGEGPRHGCDLHRGWGGL